MTHLIELSIHGRLPKPLTKAMVAHWLNFAYRWLQEHSASPLDSPSRFRHSPSLSIALVDAPRSQQLNAQYRGQDKATNILSFAEHLDQSLDDSSPDHLWPRVPSPDDYYLGELVVCGEVMIEQAKQQDKTLCAHFAHIMIHGLLHLLGYDHIEEHQAVKMERLEIDILTQYGYKNPYIQH